MDGIVETPINMVPNDAWTIEHGYTPHIYTAKLCYFVLIVIGYSQNIQLPYISRKPCSIFVSRIKPDLYNDSPILFFNNHIASKSYHLWHLTYIVFFNFVYNRDDTTISSISKAELLDQTSAENSTLDGFVLLPPSPPQSDWLLSL